MDRLPSLDAKSGGVKGPDCHSRAVTAVTGVIGESGRADWQGMGLGSRIMSSRRCRRWGLSTQAPVTAVTVIGSGLDKGQLFAQESLDGLDL